MNSKEVLKNLMTTNKEIVVILKEDFDRIVSQGRRVAWASAMCSVVCCIAIIGLLYATEYSMIKKRNAHKRVHEELIQKLDLQFDLAYNFKEDIRRMVNKRSELHGELYDYLSRHATTAEYYHRFGIPVAMEEEAIARGATTKASKKAHTKVRNKVHGQSKGVD